MNLTPPPGTPVVKRSRAKATTTAAAPESKKPTLTTKTTRSRKKTVAEPVATPVVESTVSYTSDQLRSLIAMAAYYRAEARNFAPGNEMEDWLVAEQQVIANLT